MPEFLIDDDGSFTGSTALCVTMPDGGLVRVVEKCELLDDTWEAIVSAAQRPEGVTVTEWGVRLAGGSVTSTGYLAGVSEGFARAAVRPDDGRFVVPPSPESVPVAVMARQRTTFPDVVTEWAEVSGDTEAAAPSPVAPSTEGGESRG